MAEPYQRSTAETLADFSSSEAGLTAEAAARLQARVGKNELEEAKGKTLPQKIWAQIKDPMIIVLIAAAIVSGAFGETTDMIIILIVVVLNTILGIVQENKAEDAIKALKKSSAPHANIRRDNKVISVYASEIVPGDIVLLEAGDTVPADMRLLHAVSLRIEEAALTGESVPAEKSTDALDDPNSEIVIGDRTNMAYMGTSVTYGKGEGVVTNTGMSTEMGKIAHMLAQTEDEQTPLQRKLAHLSKILSLVVIGISVVVFILTLVRSGSFSREPVFDALLIAISLAVAAIPEGLVVVVTVLLSLGVTRMSKRNAIIRRLSAVETLGSTQVICSDKTGTLTQNKMTVTEEFGDTSLLATAMALCNNTQVSDDGSLIGDPTETALYVFGTQQGPKDMLTQYPRVAEAPFDSERKMMSTVHQVMSGKPSPYRQFTKGAPDVVLENATHLLVDGVVRAITDEDRALISESNAQMAAKELRVLAAAYRDYENLPKDDPKHLETNLIFIGLTGMIDPIRPEAKAAVEECRRAGIRVIMITGDHKDTAVAIARDLGILHDASQAITGTELNELDSAAFAEKIDGLAVYARVQPEHKVRIVDAWKSKERICAMTGDGVNDAPALKSADIGVGMGITGTDVTKNVSDMVLTDDNFATIVAAVEEGRRIYANIQKVIQFLLSSNLSEVLAIFIATILGWKLFAPIHILWINLMTDTFPALGIGMEEEGGNMDTRPRDPRESIFADGVGFNIIWQGMLIGLLTLLSYGSSLSEGQAVASSMAFLTLSLCEIFHSLNMRSLTKSIFSLKRQNRYLWAAVALSFVLTLVVMYTPGLNEAFRLVALSPENFLHAALISFLVIPIVEVFKYVKRARMRRAQNAQVTS